MDLLWGLPLWELQLIVFGFGIIIGSFLNVYIYRFHTGKSLTGHSHCLSCGDNLKAYDLLPLFSYLWLRGRCRSCGCRFSARYFFVELLTGILFVLSIPFATTLLELIGLCLLMAVLVVILVYDIRHYIIPDSLVVVATGITALLIFPYEYNWLVFGTDILAAVLGSGFLFFLWLISKGTWIGFGDVKLALPLGLLVGADYVFSMVVISFWVGAVLSLLLVGLAKLQRGKLSLRFIPSGLTIKSVVPFAPFLIAGCLIVFFTKINVLNLFTF